MSGRRSTGAERLERLAKTADIFYGETVMGGKNIGLSGGRSYGDTAGTGMSTAGGEDSMVRSRSVSSRLRSGASAAKIWLGGNGAAVFACAGCAALLLSPSLSVAAAKRGIDLWLYTVTPSLLPFFVFTDMLMSSSIHTKIGRIFERPVSRILGAPGEAAFIFVSSILSGYPTGARLIGEMRRAGTLSAEEAQAAMNFCSTSGPLFIVSAVGVGMLGSEKAGFIMLGAHCAGALLTGLLLNPHSLFNESLSRLNSFRIKGRHSTGGGVRKEKQDNKRIRADSAVDSMPLSFADAMSGAVLRSLKTIGLIGGFIIIFTVLTEYITLLGEVLGDIRIDSTELLIFTKSVNNDIILNITNILSYLCAAASAVLEMTVGCSRMAAEPLNLEMRAVICTFVISFGGLSVAAQTAGVLRGADIDMRSYMYAKLLHGLISAAIVMLIFILF